MVLETGDAEGEVRLVDGADGAEYAKRKKSGISRMSDVGEGKKKKKNLELKYITSKKERFLFSTFKHNFFLTVFQGEKKNCGGKKKSSLLNTIKFGKAKTMFSFHHSI